MKLAVNYSVEAERLVRDSVIDIDYFKCPDFSNELIENAEKTNPCYIHFGLNAGDGQMDKVNWKNVKELREQSNTPYINVHAVAYAKDYPNTDIFSSSPSLVNRIVDAAVKDIEIVAEKVGIENVIMENIVCRGQGENTMQAIIDPAIISEIVDQTGCGLLLDTAHAQLTSKCLGYDVKEYISQFPVKQLKELHITGIQADEKGRLRDSMPMTKDDWELARWVMQRVKDGDWPEPWVVSLEYGGVGPKFEWRSDQDVLIEQVPMLCDLVK
ncbi:multinuclear nonheme iron-dependent oxidase [Gracilibacillus salinarum]|uniref:DUF692 family protein n=1 Tax=Gracilibacillus salinarum TaxID=2932255 RepID=A0ABY4GQP2_9BACI|nr:DUF692 family multinuclear iron-containing protein [Gracilibacillus salinarum]UOQ86569.1 DUF692 family protein [Gracilibacillus salinarum]